MTDANEVLIRDADTRGRITLGSGYADERVRVSVEVLDA